MVVAAIFDILQFSKRAKEVGFTEAQAEFQAEEIARIIDKKLVTKEDFKALKAEFKTDFNALEKATKADMKELKKDIIIATGGMLAAAIFILPVIFKLISLI